MTHPSTSDVNPWHCVLASLHFFRLSSFFFFNDTATTEIYTLSLHDALPICQAGHGIVLRQPSQDGIPDHARRGLAGLWQQQRSEEHTSELQSHLNLVCRLLLEKKKKKRETRERQADTNYCTPLPISHRHRDA